ncbi:sulfite oxidase-like oxidoreductase [Sandarakinorhabdus cyanobacteriorum]|uniref:Sulfite oxidase-like oxidoreductase n=1 Tax=Sandarakinorhabdus cyanobacteriorum TaxID=1981098 RepID=A0A255YEX8_9SPHN|nr:sulfite oxidase-like oxidoreductase [Sandarakinorhabdus cyanobacteriorum]OYQ27244.1 sulfite oxidase-like oxidoreductase [Sandarakinorhabdus cyanobacteriorum]
MAGNGFKDRLVAIKQAWAQSGRLLTGKADPAHESRLPPGQRLVTNWPVLDLGIKPDISKAEWRLTVDGAVTNPLVWDWAAYQAQPQVEDVSDIHCVTQWSRFDNRWNGVATSHLLSVAQPLPGANVVVLHGADGYTTNVTLERFAGDDCLIAHAHDGLPLSRDHGGPVRAIIPRWYFWKSAKWLVRIEVLAVDKPGFWEVRGYHNDGDPWTEQRYS